MAAVPILRSFNDIERELLRAPPVLTAEQIEFIQSPGFTRSDKWASVHYWDTDIRHIGQSVNARIIGSPLYL
jgi:hypothetical protein